MFVRNGISNVTLQWLTAGASSLFDLSFDSNVQHVVVTRTSAPFPTMLSEYKAQLSMQIFDNSPHCIRIDAAPILDRGCNTTFIVQVVVVPIVDCVGEISYAVAGASAEYQSIDWTEPRLLAPYSFVPSIQPGTLFPLGTTLVSYNLMSSSQAIVQPVASRVSCQFQVRGLILLSFLQTYTVFIKGLLWNIVNN